MNQLNTPSCSPLYKPEVSYIALSLLSHGHGNFISTEYGSAEDVLSSLRGIGGIVLRVERDSNGDFKVKKVGEVTP